MEKLGIEQLKGALASLVNFAERIQECAQDGKINLWEKLSIAADGTALAIQISRAKQIKAEYEDLSEAERAEVIAFIRDEYDHNNAKTEEIVECAFESALALEKLIKAIAA
jgi:hypothetical protein